jgi:PAS domain S-box-containing protein
MLKQSQANTVEKMQQKTRQELLQKIKELEHECDLLKKDRKELSSADKYMRETLNNIPAPIYLKDIQGSYLMINKKYEELANVTLLDIVGKNDFDIFPQPVASLFRSQDEEVIHKGIPCEFEETISLADGIHTYITSKFPLHGKDGAISAVGGYCTDITSRKLAEIELERIVDLTPDMLCVVSPDGYFKNLNKAWEKVLGYTIEELKLKPVIELIHPDDREDSMKEFNKLLAGEEVSYFENRYQCKDDTYRVFAWNANPVAESKVYAAARDITELKNKEKEKNKLIEELQNALEKVNLLSGFLPICASCKKIRDDTGYWNQIESYIRDHSEVEFSHSICPDCAQELYPHIQKNMRKQEK